jgi:hypothetical protein
VEFWRSVGPHPNQAYILYNRYGLPNLYQVRPSNQRAPNSTDLETMYDITSIYDLYIILLNFLPMDDLNLL